MADKEQQLESIFGKKDTTPVKPQFTDPNASNYADPGLAVPGIDYTDQNRQMSIQNEQNSKTALDLQTESIFGPPQRETNLSDPGYHKVPLQDGSSDAFISLQEIPKVPGYGDGTFEPSGDFMKDLAIGSVNKSVDFLNAANRVIGGSETKALKGILSLGEYILEQTGHDDGSEAWIKDNLPTITQNSPIEDIGSDIGSMALGAVAGTAITNVALTGESIFKIFSTFTSDPRKLALYGDILKTALGVDFGSAVTTPEHATSILTKGEGTGDHLVDNLAMTAGGAVVIKALGGIGKWAKGVLPNWSGKAVSPQEAGLGMLRAVDQNITPNDTPEAIARKAKAFGTAIRQNSSIIKWLGGVEKVFTPNTSIGVKRGAVQYLREAYPFELSGMNKSQYDQWVDKEAIGIMDRFMGIRKSKMADPSIMADSSNVARESFELLSEAAQKTSTKELSNQVAIDAASPLLERVTAAKGGLDKSRNAQVVASDNLLRQKEDSEIGGMLQMAKDGGTLDQFGSFKGDLENLTGPELAAARRASKERASKAYENIVDEPLGLENALEIAQTVKGLSDSQGNAGLDLFRIIPEDRQALGKIADDTPGQQLRDERGKFSGYIPPTSATQDIAEALSEMTYKDLFGPQGVVYNLTARIARETDEKGIRTAAGDTLVQLKDSLLRMADNSGISSVREASNTFKEHAGIWLANKQLVNYDIAASGIRDMGGVKPKGQTDAEIQGFESINNMLNSDNAGMIEEGLTGLRQANPNADRIVYDAYIAQGLRAMINSKSAVTSEQLYNAFKPHIRVMRETDAPRAAELDFLIETLRRGENALGNTEEAVQKAQLYYNDLMKESKSSAGANFIYDLGGTKPELKGNPQLVYTELFRSKDATNVVSRLIAEAEAAGNTMAAEGIQGQYLRYLRDTISTSKPISPAAGGTEFVKDQSLASVDAALNDAKTNVLPVLSMIYKDSPETAAEAKELLEFIQEHQNIISNAPKSVGSDTAFNLAKENSVAKTVSNSIRIVLGPLNRMGTMLNTVLGAAGGNMDARNVKIAEAIWTKMIVSPQYLSDVLGASKSGDEELLTSLVKELVPILKSSTGILAKSTTREWLGGQDIAPEDIQTEMLLNEKE